MIDALFHGQVHWIWIPVSAFLGLLAGALCSAARDWREFTRDYYPEIMEDDKPFERKRLG